MSKGLDTEQNSLLTQHFSTAVCQQRFLSCLCPLLTPGVTQSDCTGSGQQLPQTQTCARGSFQVFLFPSMSPTTLQLLVADREGTSLGKMRSYCTKPSKQDEHTPQQLHFPSLENLERGLEIANFKDQVIYFFFRQE